MSKVKKGEKIEIAIKSKFWFFVILVYSILISGIVVAENYQIYGHDSEDFNGFCWANSADCNPTGKVGKLINRTAENEGGHSTSEIENVLWFKESVDSSGIVLKDGAAASGVINRYRRREENMKVVQFHIFNLTSIVLNNRIYSRLIYDIDTNYKNFINPTMSEPYIFDSGLIEAKFINGFYFTALIDGKYKGYDGIFYKMNVTKDGIKLSVHIRPCGEHDTDGGTDEVNPYPPSATHIQNCLNEPYTNPPLIQEGSYYDYFFPWT